MSILIYRYSTFLQQQMRTDSQQLIEQFQLQQQTNEYQRNSTSQQFDSSFDYYISMIGVSVGYGSFWRFPYVMYENGGGAFLVPYTISFIIIGVPMLYLQMTVGHMHQLSLPFIFQKMHKGLKILGISVVLILFNIVGFYNLLLTYSYRYLFTAFQFPLPFANQSPLQTGYFSQTILNKSSSITQFGEIQWFLYLIYLGSLVIIYFIIRKGVKLSGKVAAYTALAPYFFFIILVIRGFMLPGGLQGFFLCVTPDFSRLLEPGVWISAFVQVFFQLCLGCGVLVNMTSLKPKQQSNLKGLYIIPICVYCCGLLCAICVYMYVNYQANIAGLSFYELKLSGLELSFNVFPKALATLPLPNIWVFFFYIGMVCLGIDSMFGGVQGIICYIADQMRINKIQFSIFNKKIKIQQMKKIILCLIGLLGILYTSRAGIYYLQFVNKFLITAPLTVSAFIEYIFFVRIFPISELVEEQQKNTGQRVSKWVLYLLQSKFLACFLVFNLILSVIAEFIYVSQYQIVFSCMGVFLGIFIYVWAYLFWRKNKNNIWKLSFDTGKFISYE